MLHFLTVKCLEMGEGWSLTRGSFKRGTTVIAISSEYCDIKQLVGIKDGNNKATDWK